MLWPWVCNGGVIQREVQETILKKKGNGHLQAMLVWSWVGALVCKVLFCATNWFEGAFVFFCFLFKILLFRPGVLFLCFTYMFRNLRTNFFLPGGLMWRAQVSLRWYLHAETAK